MPQKNGSVSAATTIHQITDDTQDRPDATAVKDVSPTVSRFDFLSAEYNQVDELDDNKENYRAFESLAGIVTADMRHRQERKKTQHAESKRAAAKRGQGKPAAVKPEPRPSKPADEPQLRDLPPLTIISRGRLLIIDTDLERALSCAERLSGQGLSCSICLSAGGGDLSVTEIDSFPYMESRSIAVTGCFGGFTVAVAGLDNRPANLSTLIGHLSSAIGQASDHFDLILDLLPISCYAGQQLPLGYYTPGEDETDLEAALAELPEMRGRFKKPQFTMLLKNRCLQGLSPHHDCRLCLTHCPVSAVKLDNGHITIDQYRCQGCGTCNLVCPTDALLRLNPSPEVLLTELSGLLSETISRGIVSPDLFIFDRNCRNRTLHGKMGMVDRQTLYFEVEEIGHIGLEAMLAALAYGAGSVTLLCEPTRSRAMRTALMRQLELAKEIVQGLGLSAERLRLVEDAESQPEIRPLDAPFAQQAVPIPATLNFALEKRTLIRQSAQHLSGAGHVGQVVVPLSAGAPFGRVTIGDSCSLCMACVGACPAGALVSGGDLPRVSLVESRCHQCGLCAAVCPENAVQLQARLLCDCETADREAVLREEIPFACVECGLRFTTQAMIDRLQDKLAGHWMYSSDRQKRRLRMCRTCRTRDALTAGDYRP